MISTISDRSNDITKKALAQTFLFKCIPPSQLDDLAALSRLRNLGPGTQLFNEGDPATGFFVVISGQVKVYKLSPQGEEHILHLQGPGDLIAEAAIFDIKNYPAYALTLEKTALAEIPRDPFLSFLQDRPKMCLDLMAAYSKRLRRFVSAIEDLTLKNLKQRLAHHLLSHARIIDGRHVFSFKIPKRDLASLLGTIPETLSRALANLKKEGFVREEDNTLIILAPEKLESFIYN